MAKIYRVHEFAKRIGKSPRTLRRWDKNGILIAKRHPSGHRYYDESDIRRVFGYESPSRGTAVYCRVSSTNQKDDLEDQVKAMEQFCLQSGIAVDDWITEIGGEMNYKHKKFLTLLDDIQQGRIARVLIAHKDRLCRFGFEYFEHMARESGCELIVVNQESLSPKQEMVEDLLAIVHTFSCRLYGLRRYKKMLKEDLIAKNES
jgi:predicted site-specific integrase-resolvase